MHAQRQRYTSASDKIETADLDWAAARNAGLTPDERFILTYFSDIESQTIRYLRTWLQLSIAFQPPITAFLTTWSYEEFFHGQALAQLLAECGYPLEANRVECLGHQAKFNERLELMFGPLLSRMLPNQFPAVYMSFGAIQELTTLRGYERLREYTANPILRTLCERIAKQERRHFAWYFNHAREQLERSRGARLLTRTLLQLSWTPVGAGVKSTTEVRRLFSTLFPAASGEALACEIDARIATLPGLERIRLMQTYFG